MAVLEQSPWYREIEKKGFIRAISLGLELKFGEEGLQILSEIRAIDNVDLLENIISAIKIVNTLDELRQIYLA